MNSVKRVILYMLLYAIILNFSLPYIIPQRIVYNYRPNFDIIKNRISNLEAVLEQIKLDINKEDLKKYIIIIGDSVAYGSPGPSHASIGYYLNQRAMDEDKKIRIFNLAIPSMQTGDLYTLLLKLKQYGISSEYLIMNVGYSSFVHRTYGHPVATWLSEDLRHLDSEAYARVSENLKYEREIMDPQNPDNRILRKNTVKESIDNIIYTKIGIFKYKDYLKQSFLQIYDALMGEKMSCQKVMAWYDKGWLKEYIKNSEVQWGVSDMPFNMTESNEDVYFLNKIFDLQKDKNTLVFLSAINKQLLDIESSRVGFHENLKKMNNYFTGKACVYLDLNDCIENKYFSDHIHLTPKGYKFVSDLLWDEIYKWGVD